jgi:cytochrome c-type biogenesis protein CcmH/NrfF
MGTVVYTLGPVFAVIAGLWIVQRLEERRRQSAAERPPIREKLLRTAGHFARGKADELIETV